MKSKNTPAEEQDLIKLSQLTLPWIWDFNNCPGNPLADWFYSMTSEQRKTIKKIILIEEGMQDCHPDFAKALNRYKINQAIEAIIK